MRRYIGLIAVLTLAANLSNAQNTAGTGERPVAVGSDEIPVYRVSRTNAAIAIDGKLDAA